MQGGKIKFFENVFKYVEKYFIVANEADDIILGKYYITLILSPSFR